MVRATPAVWVPERRYVTFVPHSLGFDLGFTSIGTKAISSRSRRRIKEIVLTVGENSAAITDAGMDFGNHRFLVYSQFRGGSDAFGILSWQGLASNLDLLRYE
jgi:hypothetical protein